MERNGRMSFREDVFAKIVTYITIAVLLGAMLVEAFVIYMERKEKEETAAQLEAAQENISQLSELNLNLEEDREELQEFKDNWQNLVILADNETCQLLREDLAARPELIPEAAIEASVLAEEADRLGEEEADQETLPNAQFTFPSPEEKEWLLPLNLGIIPAWNICSMPGLRIRSGRDISTSSIRFHMTGRRGNRSWTKTGRSSGGVWRMMRALDGSCMKKRNN